MKGATLLWMVLLSCWSSSHRAFTEHKMHEHGQSETDLSYLLDPKQHELPLMLSQLLKLLHPISINASEPSTAKNFIPKQVWIAVRNISDPLPQHYLDKDGSKKSIGFLTRNINWKVNFCDNAAKDKFMEETFANTSLLWAYSVLNPAIGYRRKKNE